MKSLLSRHRVVTTVLVLSLALSVFFAVRLATGALYWSQHRAEAVAGWMTLRYVGRSWEVDPRDILARTGLPEPERRRMTLEDIAAAQGLPEAEVVARVQDAVTRLAAEAAAEGAAAP